MKTFLKIFLILFALLTIALAVFLWTFDLNTYRAFIENKMSMALGRTVKVGSLEMKLSLIPTIKARDIQIDSLEKAFPDKPFIKADTAEVTLSLLPLFSKRLEIQNVSFNTVNINLVSKNGQNNWSDNTPKVPSIPTENSLTDVRLDNLSVSHLNIVYQNDEELYLYTGTHFSLKQLKVFSMTANIHDIPFKISGTIDSLWDFIKKKPDFLFNIEFDGADFVTKLSGSIGDPQKFKNLLLNIDISGTNLKKTAEIIGISNKIYPTQSFNISAVMQGDTSELTVSKLDMGLGGNKLKGNFAGLISGLRNKPSISLSGNIVLSDRSLSHFWGLNPFQADLSFILNQEALTINSLIITANRTDIQISGKTIKEKDKINAEMRISSEYFDIQDIFFSEEMFYMPKINSYEQIKKAALIEEKSIKLDLLNDFNAVISVRVPHLKLSEELRGYLGVNGIVVIKDGVLSVNPLNLMILGAETTGELRLSAVDNSYHFKLSGENLQLDDVRSLSKILRDTTADVSIDLTGHGQTIKALLSSLNGQLLIDIPRGIIINNQFNDLAEKLNEQKKLSVSYSTSDRESKIICGALKADIKDGKMMAENNIALETSTINLMAGGFIDIASETMDLTVIPSLNSNDVQLGNILKTVGRFIKITGPFTDLKPELSLDNALLNILGLFNNKPHQEYQMCQQVLGRPIKAQQLKTAKQMQVLPLPPKPQVEQKPTKDNSFKQMLLDSLEEALQ